MYYTYIKFANQTNGERARSLLRNYAIGSYLKKNPNPNRMHGCNYALFVPGDIYRAFDIINKHGIPNLGVESFSDGR